MTQLSLLEQARIEIPDVTDGERIGLLARRLIAKLDAKPPVKLDMIASWQGVEKIEVVDLPCAGCLVNDGARVVMKLRREDSPRRRRFTGFHEVGHTFCPGFRLEPQYRCNPAVATNRGGIEGLCDIAASELLFPRRYLEADLVEADFGLDTVTDIAERYEGSIEAAAHTVVAVWPEDCLFLVLEPGFKKEEHDDPAAVLKLRVTSVHATGRWPFIPPNKSASEDGPLARAVAGELVDERTTLDGLCEPITNVDVSARLAPYWRADERVDRVLALFRRPASNTSRPTRGG